MHAWTQTYSYIRACSAFWNKASTLWCHCLHAAEDVLRAGITSLTMRAGAGFTVSPFNWSRRMVRFVVLEGVCCVVALVFAFFTGLISLHSWIFQISSIGCKDCHYRNDARSNRPPKKKILKKMRKTPISSLPLSLAAVFNFRSFLLYLVVLSLHCI